MRINTEEDFINLVKRAELDAVANPRLYRTKLTLFAILGYVVIFVVLTALLGLAGGLAASVFVSTGLFVLLLKSKLIFVVLIGMWTLLRALWVRFTPPEGYRVTRRQYPKLFGELDSLSSRLNALKIHEVILDSSLNAGVVQHPRLGVLGWHKNYLILGFQLLLALSPEEMRSVLAHEFGHLSGNHGRFNGWIYRVRIVWMRVMAAFDGVNSWGASLMRRFFTWYSPQFEAYSFALARSNEYEADAISAELTSADVAARALVNVHATAPYIDESYWHDYFRQADRHPVPQGGPFEGLAQFLRDNPLTTNQLQARIAEALAVETHYADTHPSLKDRIEALRATPQPPPPPTMTAAEAWLAPRLHQVMADFDGQWLKENGESWKKRYDYVAHAESQLKVFYGAVPSSLGDQELWDYACWTREFRSDEAALPLFRVFQSRYPEDPNPAYYIGHILLGQNDASGLEQLRLATNSPSLIESATKTGYAFLKELGNNEDAEAWWQESLKQNAVHLAAQKERDTVTLSDHLIIPDLEEKAERRLVAQLESRRQVGRVWIAQKVVEHYPESPVYIVAFRPKGFVTSAEHLQKEIAESLDFSGTVFVVCASGAGKALAEKVIAFGDRIL